MTKRETTREQMGQPVREFEGSGQAGAAFCRRQGLRPQRLSDWRRVLGRREAAPRCTRKRMAFAPVRVVPDVLTVSGGIEATLACGDRLAVRPGTAGELVRSVLSVLRAMLTLPPSVRIYVASGPMDLRRLDGLSAVMREVLGSTRCRGTSSCSGIGGRRFVAVSMGRGTALAGPVRR